MDVVSVIISVVFGVISVIGTGVTVYYKQKGETEKQISETIAKQVAESESKMELRVQALEIQHKNLELSTVKKDEFAELRSDLKALINRLEDFIRRAERN